MKRRDSIKTMFFGSLGATLTLKSCITSEDKLILDQVWQYNYGRTYEELKWDYKVLTGKFFSNTELKSIERIANIILCLLYTSPSPRDLSTSRMPSSA